MSILFQSLGVLANAFFSAPLVCFSPNPVGARGDQQGWTESFTSAGHHVASCLKAHPSLPPGTIGLVSFCPGFHGDGGGPEAASQGGWGPDGQEGWCHCSPDTRNLQVVQDKSVSLGTVSSHPGTSCAPLEPPDSADGERLRCPPLPHLPGPMREPGSGRGSSPHRRVPWGRSPAWALTGQLPPCARTGVVS